MTNIERLIERLESFYDFECQGGPLRNCVDWRALKEALTTPSPAGQQGEAMGIRRFTAYRRNISQRDTHTALQKNADSEPQFEGVIWTDGSVTLRWLTACKSTSVWASLADCLNIHGHPEYGTEIVWHDCEPPEEWLIQCRAALRASAQPAPPIKGARDNDE